MLACGRKDLHEEEERRQWESVYFSDVFSLVKRTVFLSRPPDSTTSSTIIPVTGELLSFVLVHIYSHRLLQHVLKQQFQSTHSHM